MQVPTLGTAAAGATENIDDVSLGSKKVRYFSNFYRQAEPDEVFVGGRLRPDTDPGVQSTHHRVGSMSINHRDRFTRPNCPFPSLTYSLLNSSLAATWCGYRFVHGTAVRSFPPSM